MSTGFPIYICVCTVNSSMVSVGRSGTDLVSGQELGAVAALFDIFAGTGELPVPEEGLGGVGAQVGDDLTLGQHLCAQVLLHKAD